MTNEVAREAEAMEWITAHRLDFALEERQGPSTSSRWGSVWSGAADGCR
jgi:hypothetical protein